jgi:hypothetical protein
MKQIKKYNDFVNESYARDVVAYHGSETHVKEFTTDLVEKGEEHEGPGIYFSSTENDARMHGGPYITKVRLRLNRLVSSRSTITEEIRTQLQYMVNVAPDKDETLLNWGKDPRKANDAAMDSICSKGSPDKAFQAVWEMFYKKRSKQYVNNMSEKNGYDGVEIWRTQGVKRYIVFNPRSVKILKSDKPEIEKTDISKLKGTVTPQLPSEIDAQSNALRGEWERDI